MASTMLLPGTAHGVDDVHGTPLTEDGYRYRDDWTGSALPWISLEEAAALPSWPMGRWPDPVLRRQANDVDLSRYADTSTLRRAANQLRETAILNGAVGLAAEQCGVDARMVYLQGEPTMVNPRIVARSPETQLRVWNERCLVLPPTFVATVLRDASVTVEYYSVKGKLSKMTLRGELARAVQHELDHDRGILVTDHVGLEELESDTMRYLEREGHSVRMQLAFERRVEESRR